MILGAALQSFCSWKTLDAKNHAGELFFSMHITIKQGVGKQCIS